MAQITCRNLTLGYDNRAIQEDLNFSIGAGAVSYTHLTLPTKA